jgi:hypothetical protein
METKGCAWNVVNQPDDGEWTDAYAGDMYISPIPGRTGMMEKPHQ